MYQFNDLFLFDYKDVLNFDIFSFDIFLRLLITGFSNNTILLMLENMGTNK